MGEAISQKNAASHLRAPAATCRALCRIGLGTSLVSNSGLRVWGYSKHPHSITMILNAITGWP